MDAIVSSNEVTAIYSFAAGFILKIYIAVAIPNNNMTRETKAISTIFKFPCPPDGGRGVTLGSMVGTCVGIWVPIGVTLGVTV